MPSNPLPRQYGCHEPKRLFHDDFVAPACPDDLDQRHDGGGVEEVKPEDAALIADGGSQGGHAQGRRVGAQHRIPLRPSFQILQQFSLDLEILRHRLDDPVRSAGRRQVPLDPKPHGHLPGLLRGHLPFFYPVGEEPLVRPADPVEGCRRLKFDNLLPRH
jgi:hypothetical protein